MEQPLPMSMSHGPQMLHDGGHLDPDEDHYRGHGHIKDEFQPLHHQHQHLLHPPTPMPSVNDGDSLSASLKQEITDLSLNGK